MLSPADYSAVRQWARDAGTLLGEADQTNVYFDAPDGALSAALLCLRLRLKKGKWQLTLKARQELDAEEQVCEEIDEALSAGDAARFQEDPTALLGTHLPPVARLRELCDATRLVRLGELVTTRAKLDLCDDFVAELDHSRYLGTEDYELELETERIDAASARLRELFEQWGIDAQRSERSKMARFMAQYR